MSLEPKLTPLDVRVLRQLHFHRSRRARDVAWDVNEPLESVLLTLRGFEHFGYARHANGWWRRA